MTSAAFDAQDTGKRVGPVSIALIVALLAAIPFLPVLENGFVTWDDDQNFVRNPFYRGLGLTQLKWMWTTFHMGHYVPLTWMSHGLDYVLWGMNPRGYHLTNLVLHAANAAVVFLVARRLLSLTLNEDRNASRVTWAAAIAALLFAMHPLRVESVAWATERRDVLSGVLYSLTVLFYLRAVERPTVTPREYAPIFALFLAALLAKATSMTLPAVLLLLNVYPLRRLSMSSWRQVVRELTPLSLLSVAAMILSLRALNPGAQLSLVDKIAVSAYGLAFYIWKSFVPLGLGPIYPMPLSVPVTSPAYLASYALVAGLALLIVLQWRSWPGVVAGLTAFVVILLPMLGIVQNGPQVAADRYTYHAAPALEMLAAAVLLSVPRAWRLASLCVSGLMLLALGALTWNQTHYWRNGDALWHRAVAVADNSAVAHDGLGTVLLQKDSAAQALAQYERAAQLNPYYASARANIGIALARLGRFSEAPPHFQRALELKPNFDMAENNWGVVMAMQGKTMAAIGHFGLALQINPENADAELNWANALVDAGNLPPSLSHYHRAVQLNPSSVEAEARWGATLAQLGKLDDAITHFQRALVLDPNDKKAKALLMRAMSERAAATPRGPRQ